MSASAVGVAPSDPTHAERDDPADTDDDVPEGDAEKRALMATALRMLALDAVENAESGHPGLPLGAADVVTALLASEMKFDASHPRWFDRDRFVLSAGHGSALLYAALCLLGAPRMTVDELKNFRRLGSLTPGHPERNPDVGIETTTGPLGQGLANAVGMAIAERRMAAEFGEALCNHRTYALVSDGDLMEGLSAEAIALAGHLRLARLTLLLDDNGISIDGPLGLADSTDTERRFEASGWRAQRVDGHDPDAVATALETTRTSDRPTLLLCRTTIGYGAPKKGGTEAAHGAPLGDAEAEATRRHFGWTRGRFEIPHGAGELWRLAGLRGGRARREWEARLADADAETRREFERRLNGDVPAEATARLRKRISDLLSEPPEPRATRAASKDALEDAVASMPELVGGSADLAVSTCAKVDAQRDLVRDDYGGAFLRYGVREHAMAGLLNGLALHGGVRPYGGTFLAFSDYCRPALRLAALMKLPVAVIFSHDSIGVGEDGPTHQPIEHLAALRAIPNLLVMRPADAVETAECWSAALHSADAPVALVLSRQALPQLRGRDGAITENGENLSALGAYELRAEGDQGDRPAVVLFASGSETAIAVDAAKRLADNGHPARTVSVPCMETFRKQDEAHIRRVLGNEPVRVAVEAGIAMGWSEFIGDDGIFVGMSGFGESAPAEDLYKHFNITADNIVERVAERTK